MDHPSDYEALKTYQAHEFRWRLCHRLATARIDTLPAPLRRLARRVQDYPSLRHLRDLARNGNLPRPQIPATAVRLARCRPSPADG